MERPRRGDEALIGRLGESETGKWSDTMRRGLGNFFLNESGVSPECNGALSTQMLFAVEVTALSPHSGYEIKNGAHLSTDSVFLKLGFSGLFIR
jgi:hypothetical protein